MRAGQESRSGATDIAAAAASSGSVRPGRRARELTTNAAVRPPSAWPTGDGIQLGRSLQYFATFFKETVAVLQQRLDSLKGAKVMRRRK